MSDSNATQTDDARALLELETSAHAEVLLPADAHNRPFLRCLQGLARALLRRDRREEAAAALRRLLRLGPADHLGARASLTAVEAGKTWREMEAAP